MARQIIPLALVSLLPASFAPAQATDDPFPDPIPPSEGAITINVTGLAALPDVGDQPARMMPMVDFRIGPGPGGRVFLRNKRDGVIGELRP